MIFNLQSFLKKANQITATVGREIEDGVFESAITHPNGRLEFEWNPSRKIAWVTNLEVDPAFRKQGIATMLLEELFQTARGGIVHPGTFVAGEASNALLALLKRLALQHHVRLGDHGCEKVVA